MLKRHDLARDLIFPTILFGAIGGMTWAVRGSSGYGAAIGCMFAGVLWGVAWWFIARDPRAQQTRRYASGWIVLAMTVAFGVAGARGWMQWPHFFEHKLYLDFGANRHEYISRTHGFLWMFIAGIPWAGLAACTVAWCASGQRTTFWQWIARLACGIGMAWLLSVVLFDRFPQVFLPLYDSLQDKYQDLTTNRTLWKLVRDNREAMFQLGLYLGFLLYEVLRRDWKNVVLILAVGLLNGAGWSALQNWKWAKDFWPGAQFNFWRCWESSGGISIGVALGVAYYLVNRRQSDAEISAQAATEQPVPPSWGWLASLVTLAALAGFIGLEVMPPWCAVGLITVTLAFGVGYFIKARGMFQQPDRTLAEPWSYAGSQFERWGMYAGLILGLGLSIKSGLKGWANIYLGDERYWNHVFMNIFGTAMILSLAGVSLCILFRQHRGKAGDDPFPHAYVAVWVVVLVQNILGQLVTGPPSDWYEVAFNIYYVLLFLIMAVILHHYHTVQQYEKMLAGPREARV